jgi:hypothetical protein
LDFIPGRYYNFFMRIAGTKREKCIRWNLKSVKHNGLTD